MYFLATVLITKVIAAWIPLLAVSIFLTMLYLMNIHSLVLSLPLFLHLPLHLTIYRFLVLCNSGYPFLHSRLSGLASTHLTQSTCPLMPHHAQSPNQNPFQVPTPSCESPNLGIPPSPLMPMPTMTTQTTFPNPPSIPLPPHVPLSIPLPPTISPTINPHFTISPLPPKPPFPAPQEPGPSPRVPDRTHSMRTRSQSGIFKRKAWLSSRHPLQLAWLSSNLRNGWPQWTLNSHHYSVQDLGPWSLMSLT